MNAVAMNSPRDLPGIMSRRKQLKPRALKRELDDEADDSCSVAMSTTTADVTTIPSTSQADDVKPPAMEDADTNNVTMDTPEAEDEAVPKDVPMATAEEEEEESEAEYQCEMCDTVFQDLAQFMDHRNFDCTAAVALEGLYPWQGSGLHRMSSHTPFSLSPPASLPGSDPPESPGLAGYAPDQVPFSTVVTETHPYGCQHCEKAFVKVAYLRKHEQVHRDTLPYKCALCSRVFKNKQARDRHARVHTEGRYRCVHCHASFGRSEHLKMHLKTHDTSKLYPCPVCQEGFPHIGALTTHMMIHRTDRPQSLTAEGDQPGSGDLACLQCGDKCQSVEDLHVHLQTHNEELAMAQDKTVLSCPYCAEIFTEEEVLELHIEQAHTIESINKCPICAMCFLDNEDLTLHLKSHETAAMLKDAKLASGKLNPYDYQPSREEDIPKLDCPYCRRKGFITLGMLNVHIRTMHAGAKDHLFSCQVCQVGFATSQKLIEHMSSDHPGLIQQEELEIKFPCDYCTLEFNSSESLRTHKGKIHKILDAMPKPVDVVYCSQCTMGFPHIYALAEHMHNVHGYNQKISPTSTPTASSSPNGNAKTPDAIKTPFKDAKNFSPSTMPNSVHNDSYLCDHCNTTFQSLNSYQAHLKSHADLTKFTCTECKAEFTSEDQLENHMFVHFLLLATQYGCTCCLKLFSTPDELQKHLMDIHAHHLYRCALCKEVFDSKVNVQVHFAIKHSNECKLYKCSSCGSVFRSEMEWQLHVKVYHLGISKPYRCFYCKDSFTSEAELQTHTTTHKKQFPCPLCEDAFHVEYLLDKHMQTHHCPDRNKVPQATKLKVEPPMTEMEMQYTSPTSSSLTKSSVSSSSISPNTAAKHQRMANSTSPNMLHQPKKGDLIYKCEICDVKFCDESTLQKHRVHDHGMSPEMQLVIQKSQQAKASQQALNASPKGGQGSSEKFSQLCVYCNQTFKTKGELEKHMKTHVTPSNQKCNICDEIFPSASILAEHKLTHCKVVKGNVCVVCKVTMKSEEQFYTHSQQHGFQGTNMQCVVCRQTLASMLELQMHARHHFQNPTNFYTCCVCVKSFNSKENLISKLNTSGRTYYVCKPCYHGEVPMDHRCTQCNVKFENKMQLEMHMLQHQKTFQCIKCQQSFNTEYEIQMHVATHVMQEGNVHECKICCQIFESPAKLQCHLIEHTFDKTDMKCYVCGLMFTQASAIQMHVLEHGVGGRQYSCTQCPQKFFFSAELQNHLYMHSPGPSASAVQECRCPECGKVFQNVAQLKSHMKIHKKDGPLQCSLCMEPFPSMVELQQHFFLAHSGLDFDKPLMNMMPTLMPPDVPNPKKPAQCVECGKEFPSINSLQGHMRVHSSSYKARNNTNTNISKGGTLTNGDASLGMKHPCPECGKELSSSKNLAFHMRVHTGEKPYECPVCHKRFSRKENRRSHMKTHSGVKPYTCPVCHRSFARRCHVKEHIKVHFTQPTTLTCEFCSEVFSHMRHMRHHLVTTHNKTAEFICKLCSESFASSKLLRGHFYQVHHMDDDLLETLSVGSDDHTKDANIDQDGMDDTSDSLSLNSDNAFPNGQENVEPPVLAPEVPLHDQVNGEKMDVIPKLEAGEGTIITVQPEQLIVQG